MIYFFCLPAILQNGCSSSKFGRKPQKIIDNLPSILRIYAAFICNA